MTCLKGNLVSENGKHRARTADGRDREDGRRRRRFFSLWKSLLIGGLTLSLLMIAFLGYFFLTLPIGQEDGRPSAEATALVLADRNGDRFGTRGAFVGDMVELAELPPYVPAAVISIEDRRFYRHFGVDPIGLARAAVANLLAGDIRQGGSTITQQLARVLYLNRERTFSRKIHELMIALWLESRMTKDEILARYLNEIYFGGGAHGIDGAARRYFAKPASRLNLSEAAMLAGLIKAPSALAPTNNLEAARARAEVVLATMVETGAITREMAEYARAHPAELAIETAAHPDRHYFSDWVAHEFSQRMNPARGTVQVVTTLDPELQDLAAEVVASTLAEKGAEANVGQAALVAMAPDGAVLAMVGGRSYEESQFNRAVQARRQPGSLFKIFVYLAALDAGYRPSDTLVDRPVNVGGWTPENYGETYKGPIPLRTALASSINSIAVQLAEEVGVDNVIAKARSLGISTELRRDLSLALGTSEVTLMEMTGAFAGIANGGDLVRPWGIAEVLRDGEAVYRRRADRTETAGEAVLPWKRDQILDMMRAVVTSGTGQRAAFGWPSAGKTGTSQDYRDAWFVGFTDHLIAGVWVGNDDESPMKGVTGGSLPAEIWREFMAQAHVMKGYPKPRPPKPVQPAPQVLRSEPPPDPARTAPQPRRETSFERDLRRLGDAILSIFD